MKKLSSFIGTVLVAIGTNSARADPDLFDWGVLIDGKTVCAFDRSCGALGVDHLPGNVGYSPGFFNSGLGNIAVTIRDPGKHTVALFVDHEIDETGNTYLNEYGGAQGSPAQGQSWQIDEPGFLFGTIFGNFAKGVLNNRNELAQGSRDDVAMALAWSFELDAGQVANLTFAISRDSPNSGFYLSQYDPDNFESTYMSSDLTIEVGEAPAAIVPVPTLSRMGSMILGLLLVVIVLRFSRQGLKNRSHEKALGNRVGWVFFTIER